MDISCYFLSARKPNRGDFMITLADVIILLLTGLILFLIIFKMVKHQDEGVCKRCAYAKKCTDDCSSKK